MPNTAYLIIEVIIYAVGIILLALKYRDIKNNPEKYKNSRLQKDGDELIRNKKVSWFF